MDAFPCSVPPEGQQQILSRTDRNTIASAARVSHAVHDSALRELHVELLVKDEIGARGLIRRLNARKPETSIIKLDIRFREQTFLLSVALY